MPRKVGSRDLKTRLGTYLRLVREGVTFVVTDRGRPVAELRPLTTETDDRARLRQEMAAEGQITLPTGKMTDFRPVPLRGRPISDTISEDREDRF